MNAKQKTPSPPSGSAARPSRQLRTRFAPSPTGFLHIGGARTALFSYAYARRHQGEFVLRIEDTDVERSTAAAVQAILEAMDWLKLDYDEGPFFQMQRLGRYRLAAEQLLASGAAYYCTCSKERLAETRAAQEARGDKARYDRHCRAEPRTTPTADRNAVLRFATPLTGTIAWEDRVKGRIEIANTELDDLVLVRADGTPTYNFCVVVDDWEMQITDVIRGDDHVNNTPRQIHILEALGAPVPRYAHLPMILREDGQKMSKRSDAVSVMQYRDLGILPEALLNYLARLGWGHGNHELFTLAQFIEWFDLNDVSPSGSRFDFQKLCWVNAHYLKQCTPAEIAVLVLPFLKAQCVSEFSEPSLEAVASLYQTRVETLVELASSVRFFYQTPLIPADLAAQHCTDEQAACLRDLAAHLETVAWNSSDIGQALKQFTVQRGLKFPQLAMPVRVWISGTDKTPSLEAVLAVLPRETALTRLRHLPTEANS